MRRMFKGLDSQEIIVRTRRILSMQRMIATVVLIAMILSMIPFHVFASDSEDVVNDEVTTTEQGQIQNYDVAKKDIPIVAEDPSRRSESEKHFRKQDGSYEVVLYDGAVHYQVGDEWLDIDNTLTYEKETDTYKNKANQFDIKFPKDITHQAIKLKMSDYEINWQLIGSSSSVGLIEAKEKISSDDLRELVNINETITYSDIYSDIDLSYTLSGSKIKEAFILKKYQENVSFQFEYTLKNLSFVETDEGVFIVNEAGQTVFSLDSLIMYDGDHNESLDIDMTIEQTKKDTYIITITPNDEWMVQATYPVTIDPTLDSSINVISISDTYIWKLLPNNNYSTSSIMYLSHTSSLKEYKGLLYFYLPTIVMDQTITYANLTLKKNIVSNGSQLNIYQNTELYTDQLVTWNNAPDYDESVIDYYTVNTETPFMFDITESVKVWQSEGYSKTPGFTIALDEGYGASNSVYQMGASYASQRPVITIGYEDPAGLKDYWTYTSQDMGALGTGYISDYTGNLTWVRNEFSLNNEYMSLTLNMFYSYAKKDENIGYGYGWKTNYHMRIMQDVNDIYYLYKPDGEKIYFQFEETVGDSDFYIAENGSLMELEVTSSYFYVRTQNDIEYRFENSSLGRLNLITNTKTEHQLTVFYTNLIDQKILYVFDEVDNYISFSYDIDGFLNCAELFLSQSNNTYQKIEYKEYDYDSSDNLNYVVNHYNYNGFTVFSSANYLHYTYSGIHQLAYSENLSQNYNIDYDYYANGKVSHVETNDSGANTADFDISYQGNMTTYTNYDNAFVDYLFDQYGHTVNIIDNQGNAQYFKYAGLFTYVSEFYEWLGFPNAINDEPNYELVHSLLEKSSMISQTQNRIVNHGFETIDGWIFNQQTGSVSYDSIQPLLGEKSLKITNDGSNPNAYQAIHLQEGTYSAVAYIKNSGAPINGQGAYIDVLNATTVINQSMVYDSDEWTKATVEFTVSSSTSITIKLYNKSLSTAYFDSVSLYDTTVDTRYNEITNAGFESGSTNPWQLINANIVTNDTTDRYYHIIGDYSINISGDGAILNQASQTISGLTAYAGEVYFVGAWAKADAVPNKEFLEGNDGRLFGIRINFFDSSSTQLKSVYLPFETAVEDWQYKMVSFVIPDGATSAVISMQYRGEGEAFFDNIQFYHDDIRTLYSYTNGLMTGIHEANGATTIYGYDENGNLNQITKNDTLTEFEYDEDNKVIEIEQNNVKTYVEYDANTNHVVTQCFGYDMNKDASQQDLYFKTTTTYAFDDQYIDIITDEFGKQTNYDYDELNGLLSLITDANGNTVNYDYTDFGQLLEQTFGDDIVYDYDYDTLERLYTVSLELLTYTFNYNNQDQLTSVMINGDTIVSFTYKTKTINTFNYVTNQIETKTYDNGDVYTFHYNDQDLLYEVLLNNVCLYQYLYDSSGTLTVIQDIVNGKMNVYTYDLSGRIDTVVDESGNKIIYDYDESGNLSDYTYVVSSIIRQVQYHYNQVTGTYDYTTYNVSSNTVRKDYNYAEDSLKRIDDITLKIGLTNLLVISYEYDDGHVDSTMGNATTRIFNINYDFHDGTDYTYQYWYDDNQNILFYVVLSNGDKISTNFYTYDDYNRLEREDVAYFSATEQVIPLDSSFTVYYDYDLMGNITKITTQEYNVDKNASNPLKSITYHYDQSNWMQLDYYDILIDSNTVRTSIEYDDIGNPVEMTNFKYKGIIYNHAILSWEGRKLTNISIYSTTGTSNLVTSLTYRYNSQGIRTYKEDSSEHTYEYILDGELVLVEIKDGTSYIYYTYDVDGKPISINYQGNEYFYVYDLQGNVIGLIDDTGTQVVEYQYDAYGNILYQTTSALAQANPYRYRGYRYDEEMGYYYLQSRYYDPEIGRFLNMDDVGFLTADNASGINLYAYCANNPVMFTDPSGESIILIVLGILAVGVLSGLSSMSDLSEGEDSLGAFMGGFFNGVVATTGLAIALAAGPISWGGIAIAGGFGFAGGFFGDIITQQMSYGNFDIGVAAMYGANSAIFNLAIYFTIGSIKLYGQSSNFTNNFKEVLSLNEFGVGVSVFFNSFTKINFHKYRRIEPEYKIKDLNKYDWGY